MVVSKLQGLGLRKERGTLVQTWTAGVLCLHLADLVFCVQGDTPTLVAS